MATNNTIEEKNIRSVFECKKFIWSKIKATNAQESEIDWILAHVLSCKRSEIINYNEVSQKQYSQIATIVEKRKTGLPLAYCLGFAPFYGKNIHVNENVLIPRFETEELTKKVIDEINSRNEQNNVRVLDLCTGSGCITKTLLDNCPKAQIIATDVSREALVVAASNVRQYERSRVRFLQGDLYNALMSLRKICRGDLFYADFAQAIGSEQGGVRPVIIVQNDVGNKYSTTVIVAAITSRRSKTKIPTHVTIPANDYGIPKESIALLEQIRTIDKMRLQKYVGHLDDEIMSNVDKALYISLGLKQCKLPTSPSSMNVVSDGIDEDDISPTFDIIVSNPPYIATDDIDTLDPEVKLQPRIALDGGNDGLEFFRTIIGEAKNYLNNYGKLFVEIGYNQGQAVYELFAEAGFVDVTIEKDINGKDRIVHGAMIF